MKRVASTLHEAEQFIREQRPFRLRGSGQPTLWATTETPAYLGKIPPRHSAGVESADYWVFSYETVIAWVTDGEPTVPDVGYSLSTSQHQYLVAAALGVDFYPARGRDTAEIPRNDELYGRPRRLRRGGIDGARPEDRTWRDGYAPGDGALVEPRDPHEYDHPGMDRMSWHPVSYAEQDELIKEVWSRAHP